MRDGDEGDVGVVFGGFAEADKRFLCEGATAVAEEGDDGLFAGIELEFGCCWGDLSDLRRI